MSQNQNRYRADLRDFQFLLFEQFKIHEFLGKGMYADWGKDEIDMVLTEVYKWSKDVLGPIDAQGDAEGCKLVDGKVLTPPGFKEAWKSLYEAGWRTLSAKEEHGGQAGPIVLSVLAGELMSGANTSFNMYPGLTQGVAEVLTHFGTDDQKKNYISKLQDGKWAGTMCLTEPQAGSDVGASTTKATPIGDGRYKIEGTKIYISAGDHDLTDNIMHLVLARTPDAPAGTKGLSLFLVPRDKLDTGESNFVGVGGIEHKMGIRASATCILNFSDGGDCIGELVGSKEGVGMKQMFVMMNEARIAVGIQGLAVASAAYLNALDYAKERTQGPHISKWKDASAPKVPIIQHPNVRRMLLDMKAKVEGIRALIVKLSQHVDRERVLRGVDDAAADYHKGQVDLLVPVVKAYSSDQAFEIAATGIQVMGGAGYLADYPLEQYCRDAKIFSIYEGTNGIQALDLVGRKLGQKGGANFQAFIKDVNDFIAANKDSEVFGKEIERLSQATEAVMGSAMRFLGWFQGGKMAMVPLNANRFLDMVGDTCVGWLLLQQAVIAEESVKGLAEGHNDRGFYAGKHYAAKFFANQVLPNVVQSAQALANEDSSALEIPEEAFAQ